MTQVMDTTLIPFRQPITSGQTSVFNVSLVLEYNENGNIILLRRPTDDEVTGKRLDKHQYILFKI